MLARRIRAALALSRRARTATSMSPAVRQLSPDPDSLRPDKRPRLDIAQPAVHIGIEHSAPQLTDIEAKTAHPDASTSAASPPAENQLTNKQKNKQAARERKKAKKKRATLPEPYSTPWVVAQEVERLLGKDTVDQAVADGTEYDSPFDTKDDASRTLEVTVSHLSSTGNSLALAPAPHRPWVIITPHALPGEKIRVRVYDNGRFSSQADLLDVIEPNPGWRDMSRVKCKYFTQCSGCQYQMLSYEKQLELKRDFVVRAYAHYSNLPPTAVPEVLPTISSPLQYHYRTKLTPHFDLPRKGARNAPDTKTPVDPARRPDWLNIGFNRIGTRKVLDIEECPIATETVNEGLKAVREDIVRNIHTYKSGATLCLRDSLEPAPSSSPAPEKHVCVTDPRGTVRERVGAALFEYSASAFFQNNNAVLGPLTAYVRAALLDPPAASPKPAPTHLIDAYCGSGLFAITLAPHFQRVAGIEIAPEGVRAAQRNAALNGYADAGADGEEGGARCTFVLGDAADVFAGVRDFPRARTALIIDPPRKGTDQRFVEQMLAFGCEAVVYVSCNVHTQARDVGMILSLSAERGVGPEGRRYVVESIRGFDLFPQTAHVESVAVLRLV